MFGAPPDAVEPVFDSVHRLRLRHVLPGGRVDEVVLDQEVDQADPPIEMLGFDERGDRFPLVLLGFDSPTFRPGRTDAPSTS